MKINKWISFLTEIRQRFRNHHINDYSATLAFFWFLAIFPTFFLVFGFAAFFRIDDNMLIEQIEILVPGSTVRDLFTVVYDVSGNINVGVISFGALIVIWSATNGTARLVKLTVFAYGETEVRGYMRRRLIGLITLAAWSMGAVILVVFHIFSQEFLDLLYRTFPKVEEFSRLATLTRYVVSTIILIFAFSAFYMIAPQQRVRLTEALPGAVFAVISWQLLSTGYSVYVERFTMFGETYGTIGLVILLQIWLYLTAATMLIGAEINASWPKYMKRQRKGTHFP